MDVSGLGRSVARRAATPVLWRVLGSPAHWPLSEWLAVVSVESHGDPVRVPVSYQRDGDELYVVAVRENQDWWRAFRDGATCTLALAGEHVRATGELVTDAVEHQQRVSTFLHPAGAFAGRYGDGGLDDESFTNYVLVRLALT